MRMRYATMLHCFILLCLFNSLFLSPTVAITSDTITPTQPLTDNQTIVSAGEVFELGFFTPVNNSKRWYLGIWYKNMPTRTIVWVANRDNPLTNSSGVLTIGGDGNIVIINQTSNIVWSTNVSRTSDTIAQLLDSGNFVLRRENDYVWQSFDHPTDTLLPEMKLGWDSKTGLNRYLNSWKIENDPTSGDYTFKLDVNGFPEIFLANKQVREYRSGPWNGLRFSGVPEMEPTYIFNFTFTMNPEEIYYSFELRNKSILSRLMVNPSGVLQRFTWIEATRTWNRFWYAPKDQCDTYRECGVNGICDTNASPVCQCIHGFNPKNPQAWFLRDGSDGCYRVNELNCRDDGFLPLKNMKLPETESAFDDKTMSLADCENLCRRNCSCTAYGRFDITGGGSGCVIWSSDLVDLRKYAVSEGGQDLYVRVAAADVEQAETIGSANGLGKTKRIVMVVCITVGGGFLLIGLTICFLWKRKTQQHLMKRQIVPRGIRERSQDLFLSEAVILSNRDHSDETTTDERELPLFDFGTIAMATDNFSDENKLGQGGFGCVYMGILAEGQEIAVKRLSKTSGQGVDEFKNELRLIARLQHRNLVRLLGCCIEMEEKMLIYEYMEHRSLDCILFNQEKSSLLDWKRRFNIICGTARGLLYLHQDSRFRIIHRDLKASNILLDGELNPKISDFGMARIFGGDQTEANTKRIVGTYGYMSPEYAMDGLFSVKSDAFSFGVLVLEIVTGKKNRGFYNTTNNLNLLGHAWRLWRERKGLELMDTSAGDSYSPWEVLRCIQVGLLCVQEQAEDRPNMSSVVLMLSSETATMPQPKHPGFCLRRPIDMDSSSSKQDDSCTVNHVTVTMLDGR